MTGLWVVLAFVGGMAFMWRVAFRLLYRSLGRSLMLERACGRMDYEGLLRVRDTVQKEIVKRRAPEGENGR